jgi:hypothetical protein
MPLPLGYAKGVASRIPVAGMNRYLRGVVLREQLWANPSTIDADGVSAAHLGANEAGTTATPIDGALATGGVATFDFARNVVITVTHNSSVVAMSGVITGTDIHGRAVTEAWSVTATGTSKVFTGAVAFKTITGITEVVLADASANTIIAGDGKVLGLDLPCKYVGADAAVKEMEDVTIRTNGVLVARSASANADRWGTYTPNGTLNGALDFLLVYIVDEDWTG